ncbi:hypothetical protein [Ramlibacter sp. 2FC]|uniref:hypothetical protein n=1 Tax=Ramlibacter sp. 2FC TaxID=2502188 RepID=UPI0010F4DAB8|nr:hypothetical protein [Ramlibacter sp. 2FC]
MHVLVLADSEVSVVSSLGDGVRIRLSAAHVLRSEAGTRPTPGFARRVELWLPGAALPRPSGEFLGRIAQGRAQFGGRWASQLALPSSCAGPVTLELAFANRSQLLLQATGLACRYEGEANFSESLFC